MFYAFLQCIFHSLIYINIYIYKTIVICNPLNSSSYLHLSMESTITHMPCQQILTLFHCYPGIVHIVHPWPSCPTIFIPVSISICFQFIFNVIFAVSTITHMWLCKEILMLSVSVLFEWFFIILFSSICNDTYRKMKVIKYNQMVNAKVLIMPIGKHLNIWFSLTRGMRVSRKHIIAHR